MNQWLLLQRIKGPAFLLMFGVTALLDEFTSVGYSRSWPLYLILWGVLALADRAALAQADLEHYAATGVIPGQPYPTSTPAAASTSIVPAPDTRVSSGLEHEEGRQ
jgi:hypothetical protein